MNDIISAQDDWRRAEQLGEKRASQMLANSLNKKQSAEINSSDGKSYYDNGRLKMELVRKGINNSLRSYDESGILVEEARIDSISGKYQGIYKQYYRSGNIAIQGYYNEETPYGKWMEYYDNNKGQLREEYEFESGQKQGSDKYYHANGQLWTERI